MNPEIIGFAAGFCTTFCAAPQLIKMIASGESDDVSIITWSMAAIGSLLWVIYGLMIGSYALVICDSIALVLTGAVLAGLCKRLLLGGKA